jgi:hypothetical protein
MTHDTLVNGVPGELELTTYNFIANVIDDCYGTTFYLNRTSSTQYIRGTSTGSGRTPKLRGASGLAASVPLERVVRLAPI